MFKEAELTAILTLSMTKACPNQSESLEHRKGLLVRIFYFKMPATVTLGIYEGVMLVSGDWQQIIFILGI